MLFVNVYLDVVALLGFVLTVGTWELSIFPTLKHHVPSKRSLVVVSTVTAATRKHLWDMETYITI